MIQTKFSADSFDPLGPGMISNPFDLLAEARRESPVFYMPKHRMWCVTRYEDVLRVFSEPQLFSSARMVRRWPPPPETAPDLPEGHPLEGAPVSTDPPRHTRLRKPAQQAFSPRLVAGRAEVIEAIANQLTAAFPERGEVDVVAAYGSKIPPRVVGHLLGVPPQDTEQFRDWAHKAHDLGFVDRHGPDQLLALSRQMVDFDRYIRALIAERRRSPQDDLTTHLITVTTGDGEPALSEREIVSIIASMVAAGSDTTSTLIGHCIYRLLASPDLWERAKSDPEFLAPFIEEVCRLHSPARALRRFTTRSLTIGGVDIPAESMIYLHVGAANRDPEVFENPDQIDIERENLKKHLGFGIRTHFCLGAGLARLETSLALRHLIESFPEMRLAAGQGLADEDYVPNLSVPSLRRMRVYV